MSIIELAAFAAAGYFAVFGLGFLVRPELVGRFALRWTDEQQVHAMVDGTVERFGGLHVLVNNAWGGGAMVRLKHTRDEQMALGPSMAFWAAYWSVLRAFPTMRDAWAPDLPE